MVFYRWYVNFLVDYCHRIDLTSFPAYRDDLGVFVHAFDNSDVTLYGYLSCWGPDNGGQDGLSGGDHMQLGIWGTYKRINGAWCDNYHHNVLNFICKSVI